MIVKEARSIKRLTIQLSDSNIIQRILEGDKKAFRLLYDKYCRLFLLVCRRYFKTKQDAEDMLQESFVSIYKDLRQFDSSKGKFQHWAKRVVINTCLQKLRKKTVLDDFDDITEKGYDIGVSPEVINRLSLQELTSIIHKLPPGRKLIFNLYVIDGYTHKEISQQLGISISTSKTQLMKAKKLLKSDILNSNFFNNGNYA